MFTGISCTDEAYLKSVVALLSRLLTLELKTSCRTRLEKAPGIFRSCNKMLLELPLMKYRRHFFAECVEIMFLISFFVKNS